MRGHNLEKPTVPINYVRLLLDLAAEHGVHRDAILDGTGIDDTTLDQPDARISLLQYRQVCEASMTLTGNPALGCEFGLRATLTTHGMVGFGLMSQPNLRQVFTFGVGLGAALRLPAWNLAFRIDDNHAVIDAVESVRNAYLHRFACEQLLVSLVSILRDILPDTRGMELHFDYPEPGDFAPYRDHLPPAFFGTGVTQLRIPAEHLDQPLRTADALAARIAEHECQRELALFGPGEDVIRRIRAALVNERGSYPDLPTMAQRLHMSARTLMRRLDQVGSSYRQLLDEARRRDGIRLLGDPALTLADIAHRLGYSSAASFSRAFRAWTGQSPGQYRMRREDRAAGG